MEFEKMTGFSLFAPTVDSLNFENSIFLLLTKWYERN